MVNVKAALSKARGSRKQMPRGRAVVEVASFDKAAGTVTGKVIDGMGAGETITFTPGGRLTVADYTKKGRTFVEAPGGLLRVEGIEPGDKPGIYKTRWVKTFAAKRNPDENVLTGQIFKLSPTSRKDSNGIDIVRLNMLVLKDEKHVTDMDDFRSAVREGFEAGGFSLYGVTPDNDIVDFFYYRKGERTDEGYVLKDVDLETEDFFKGLGDEITEALQVMLANGGISIVPTRSVIIGSSTWQGVQEKIEEAKGTGKPANGGPIELSDFTVANLGGRFARALTEFSEAEVESIRAKFLAQADDETKVSFGSDGFGGMTNDVMRKFFASHGANPIEVEEMGYSTGSIVTKFYDAEKPENGFMVIKTFGTYAATPMPPVKALEDVRKAYYAEMKDIAKTILEGPAATVSTEAAKAEAPAAEAPKAESPKAEAPKAAPEVSSAEADIDAMLADIDMDNGAV
jgi:hypothetical protein